MAGSCRSRVRATFDANSTLKYLESSGRRRLRKIGALTGLAVYAGYLVYRALCTLNPATPAFSVAVYLAELHGLVASHKLLARGTGLLFMDELFNMAVFYTLLRALLRRDEPLRRDPGSAVRLILRSPDGEWSRLATLMRSTSMPGACDWLRTWLLGVRLDGHEGVVGLRQILSAESAG